MSDERDSFGRFRARPAVLRGYSNAGRRIGPRAFKHYKVDQLLSADEREQYEALLADPNSTIRSLRQWLLARGHMISSNAVSSHRLHRHLEFKGERRMRQRAASYITLSRQFGAGAVVEANVAKVEMLLMQNLFEEPGDDEPAVPPEQVQVLAKLAGAMLANRLSVEQMRAVVAEAQRRADEEAARGGSKPATMEDVVERVRQILG